jgi:hypothetical protein
METTSAPFWAAPALLAAIIAALGFVGKTADDLILSLREVARDRKSRLTELYALLRAGDVAFAVQRELRKRLADKLRGRLPETAELPRGHDRLFTTTYTAMNDEERQLYSLIRAITVHTFRPLNQSLLEWLRADRYFRAIPPSHRHLRFLITPRRRKTANIHLERTRDCARLRPENWASWSDSRSFY